METTYANGFGEAIAPLLILMRSTGFFEAYVFMPTMTLLSIYMFTRVRKAVNRNGTLDDPRRSQHRKKWLFAYYTLCFLATNSTAVAFKTLIVEETDYETIPSFIAWVGPLHFYITSVALVHLWLVVKRPVRRPSVILATLYVHIGLAGGYYVAIHRLATESFDLFDVTTGISGIVLFLWSTTLNWDLALRLTRHQDRVELAENDAAVSTRSHAEAFA